MGADFKEKTKRSFEKCWDKAAVEANTPDLFSKSALRLPNCYEAESVGGSVLAVGEEVCLRIEQERIVGRSRLSPVLTIPTPTSELVQSIRDGCNVARAEVIAVDPISGVIEITI